MYHGNIIDHSIKCKRVQVNGLDYTHFSDSFYVSMTFAKKYNSKIDGLKTEGQGTYNK